MNRDYDPTIGELADAGFDRGLGAAKAGDPEGRAVLFRTVQAALLRYFRALQPATAENLVAEVWNEIAGGLRRFSGDELAFRTWVFTVASQTLRARHKRRRAPVAPPRPSISPEQDAVARLVDGLPYELAEVLLLRVVADLRVSDVATVMGRSPASVRELQRQALKRAAAS